MLEEMGRSRVSSDGVGLRPVGSRAARGVVEEGVVGFRREAQHSREFDYFIVAILEYVKLILENFILDDELKPEM